MDNVCIRRLTYSIHLTMWTGYSLCITVHIEAYISDVWHVINTTSVFAILDEIEPSFPCIIEI